MKMDVKDQIVRGTMASWSDEIERAIDNAKRTEWDKWWRRQFYMETWRIGKAMRCKSRKVKRPRRRRRPGSIPFDIENNWLFFTFAERMAGIPGVV